MLLKLVALASAVAASTKSRSQDASWPALAAALSNYPAIHAAELTKIRRGDKDARFLLLTAFHGFGNRERALVWTFAFALQRRMAFFVDFPDTTCDGWTLCGNQQAGLEPISAGLIASTPRP